MGHTINTLELDDLDEALTAIGDREDQAGEDSRRRLARVRQALEHEAGARIEETLAAAA